VSPTFINLNYTDHGWFFAKLEIKQILVLDYFGGAANVPVSDYFNAQK